MRILHLTVELPYAPGGSGGATRQFYLLRRLVQLGHQVTVLSPVLADQARLAASTMRAAGIDFRGVSRPSSQIRALTRALGRNPGLASATVTLPWYSWQFRVFWEEVRPTALALIDDLAPDVLTLEHDDLAPWVADLPPLPTVLTAHNVTWRLYESRASTASGPRHLALGLEALRHRRLARRFLPAFSGVVAMSAIDAEELRELGASRVEVVPNGADCRAIRPAPEVATLPTLLFVGSMDHAPNVDGILWFSREIWPLIAEARPEARLVVVGRGPQERVIGLRGDPRIDVAGEVPSVVPYLNAASLVIAPLRSGGGTRLKILEAFASGRAVVTTRVGAQGLDVEDGVHALLADEPERFAQAVLTVLSDGALRMRLAAAGRQLVEDRYDWPRLGDRLEQFLRLWQRVEIASRW